MTNEIHERKTEATPPLPWKKPIVWALTLVAVTLVGLVLLNAFGDFIYSTGRLREIAAEHASAGRLWQIGAGLRNYRSQHGRLPPLASDDANGRPLLSWRVHILPFLGEENLYKQFHLDEPWDSKNNAPLISKMPAVYNFGPGNKNADVGACLGKTCYVALTGVGTLFSTSDATGSLTAEQMASKQVIAVEADEGFATIWSKPEDVAITQPSAGRIDGLSGRRSGKVLGLSANGWVVLVSSENLGDKDAGNTAVVILKKVIVEPENGKATAK
jgi:hypothetical protein